MGLVQLVHADRDDGWEAFSRFQPHRYQVAKLVSGNADVINFSAWFGLGATPTLYLRFLRVASNVASSSYYLYPCSPESNACFRYDDLTTLPTLCWTLS